MVIANTFPSSAPLSSTAFQPATSSIPWFLSISIPIPLIFWFFPFHSFCPPHSSTLNTPPPSDLPLQLPLWPRQTTTTSPTPLTKKLPPPITALKPSPQGKEGSNRSFRIDYKTFSFSFDGGLILMLFTNVIGILKVPRGWVVRVWNGFSHVLPIFVIGFQKRISCAKV